MDEKAYQNPFLGINPLLHEMLLMQGRWLSFHNLFLAECFKALSAHLRGSGYRVELEETLQCTVSTIICRSGLYVAHGYLCR